jgi:hypothetical protein
MDCIAPSTRRVAIISGIEVCSFDSKVHSAFPILLFCTHPHQIWGFTIDLRFSVLVMLVVVVDRLAYGISLVHVQLY